MSSLIEMRTHAREIFLAGLASADPLKAIKQCVRLRNDQLYVADCSYDLSQIGKIVVTGCGKAAAKMALAMEELLVRVRALLRRGRPVDESLVYRDLRIDPDARHAPPRRWVP